MLGAPAEARKLGACPQVNHRGVGHSVKVDEGRDGGITAVALRDIEAGEEVRRSHCACRLPLTHSRTWLPAHWPVHAEGH